VEIERQTKQKDDATVAVMPPFEFLIPACFVAMLFMPMMPLFLMFSYSVRLSIHSHH